MSATLPAEHAARQREDAPEVALVGELALGLDERVLVGAEQHAFVDDHAFEDWFDDQGANPLGKLLLRESSRVAMTPQQLSEATQVDCPQAGFSARARTPFARLPRCSQHSTTAQPTFRAAQPTVRVDETSCMHGSISQQACVAHHMPHEDELLA